MAAGDYDVTWPTPGSGEQFGLAVAQHVARKGWCTIKTSATTDLCAEAYKQATTSLRGFDALKEEFVSDFQGRKPHGKIAFMETDYDGFKDDPLSMFDRDLTSLAAALSPVSSDTISINIIDRHPAMVWVPYGSKKEERMFAAEPLTEDDVEDGTLEKHVLYLQRRSLCFFNMVENDGGEFNLKAKDGSNKQSVSINVKRNCLVVFLSGEFSYSYEPSNTSEKHVAMVTWSLGPDPRSKISMADQVPMHDSKLASKALGIEGTSYPVPVGDRVHLMNMMCRYPGGGGSPAEYWTALLGGIDGYIAIPEVRFNMDVWCTPSIDDRIPGKSYARHGGFCKDEEIYEFDREFFGIEFNEAKFMCPGQKILLEDGYTTLHGVGYRKDTLRGKEICVFLGDTGSDWSPLMTENFEKDPTGLCGNSQALGPILALMSLQSGDAQLAAAGSSREEIYQSLDKYGGASPLALAGGANSVTCARLSNILGLNGPVGTADTACSSSLVATGVAMSFLRPRSGATQDATVNRYFEGIVSGVTTNIGPFSYIGMCALSMISPMGRCFTFDQSGDGYARGEGIGTLYLKGGDDPDLIINQLACLLGNSINQDGRSASMTAPNGPSQTAVIQASMRESGVKASDIDIAECHGTGTALGDPIEVGALRNAMEPRDTVLATASAKCHIGHLEGGAGMAGICKCVGMLRAACACPNQHLKELNPNLTIAGFPLLFQNEGISTCRNSSLTGVSSFGFGGTNGRSDLWGVTRTGASKGGEINLSKVGQIIVKCPITAGPIDYLTGEPVDDAGNKTGGLKLADVLRDEFADYGVSRHVYDGGYRYRVDELQEEEQQALKSGAVPYICGSWCGYEMQAMELIEESTAHYRAYMKIGESRCERFNICLNKKKSEAISPVVDNAHHKIHVRGPAASTGNCWLVDARDTASAGSTYCIELKVLNDRKIVSWNKVDSAPAESLVDFTHQYVVVGSFSSGKPMPMQSTAPGTWSCTFRISDNGKEDFYFLRDGDSNQAVYPASSTNKTGVAACGPDNLGQGKFWYVRGAKGEQITLTLKVVDGKVSLNLSGSSRTDKAWDSQDGFNRHSYAVSGSFTDFKPVTMTMDAPGIFRAKIVRRPGEGGIVDSFRVLVDGDAAQAFAPERDLDTPEAAATIVPGSGIKADGKFVTSVPSGGEIHVTLDLTTMDRRRIVSWKVLQSHAALQ